MSHQAAVGYKSYPMCCRPLSKFRNPYATSSCFETRTSSIFTFPPAAAAHGQPASHCVIFSFLASSRPPRIDLFRDHFPSFLFEFLEVLQLKMVDTKDDKKNLIEFDGVYPELNEEKKELEKEFEKTKLGQLSIILLKSLEKTLRKMRIPVVYH